MANEQPQDPAHGAGGLGGGTDPFGHPLPPIVDPTPPVPPIDPDELAQIEMLNEAVLDAFAADHNPAKPFAANTLRWAVTMPTTQIPGVHVDVRLAEVVEGSTNPGVADQLPAIGSWPAVLRRATTWTLYLAAPRATRTLGTVTIDVDLSDCRNFVLDTGAITIPVTNQIAAGFPPGGTITLRKPPAVAVHLEAVTVDVSLSVDGPAFYNPDASVSLSWTLSGQGQSWNDPPTRDARITCAISTAQTKVDIGFWSSVSSVGVADAVAAAVEAVSDGYLYQLVGPLIAQDIVETLTGVMENQRPGTDWIFHHLDVTPDALTFWYAKVP